MTTNPKPPFPIGSRVRPLYSRDDWQGIRTVTKWEPLRFANNEVKHVLWMKREDGVEHYHVNAEWYWKLADEQVLIPFTRGEWEAILNELYHLYVIADFGESEEDKIIMNIMDRIEKNLGIE